MPKVVAFVGAEIALPARGRGESEEEGVCEFVDLGGCILDCVVVSCARREGDLGREKESRI